MKQLNIGLLIKAIITLSVILILLGAFLFYGWQTYIQRQARSAYESWLSYIVPAGTNRDRVINPQMENSTVSEGIGYGMLFSVAFDDIYHFDRLWSYANHNLDAKGLMNWKIGKNGEILGQGSATDADQDIAYALILAEEKWPGRGYVQAAKQILNSIVTYESDQEGLLLPGDNWGNPEIYNPSYIAPAYYELFYKITGNLVWEKIAQANSNWLVKTLNNTTGLAPDWADHLGYPKDNNYGYDAIRVPIRWICYYRQNHNVNARNILGKELGTLKLLAKRGLKSGYTLEGVPTVNFLNTDYLASFTALSLYKPYSPLSISLIWRLSHSQSPTYYGNAMKVWVMSLAANKF
ncbi:endoglucanase Y [Desulfosporosinus acidiphilus SJ4]|uniref:Glucanase n=1 Tax=Desulfosporosinus acidiphilus (strain DSM 22704 / JCM 16185 / SJ4) TaxID=646529 RepID=I4D6L5_DESAJ|nr:glycosyl hydrolase family 8 [Desulfosporosinus acidiphilus]AFM41439.1 endoglucanase Y [Desulfosporosinus acidiphilus SJ4]